MSYRLKAELEAVVVLPGGEYVRRLVIEGVGSDAAVNSALVTFSAGTSSGTNVALPVAGTADCILVKNGDEQSISVRINSGAPIGVTPGGVLLLQSPDSGISSLTVSIPSAQAQAGTVSVTLLGENVTTASPPQLWVGNTSFPLANASADGYLGSQVSGAEAIGRGSRTFELPPSMAGVSHGLSVRPDAILFATSEDASDPSNYYESLFVLSPASTGELQGSQVVRVLAGDLFGDTDSGLRGVASFTDGSVLLISGTGKMTRVTLEQLIANDWSTPPPVWILSDPGDGFGYDAVCVPNTHQAWVRDWTGVRLVDLDSPPGPVVPLKYGRGSNFGVFGGFIAMSADGGLHIVREHSNSVDKAYFGPEVLGALTGVQSNPLPTNVMTSAEFPPNFDDGVSIYAIDLDTSGGGWIGEYRWDTTGEIRALYFSNAAMSSGGPQIPERVIVRPSGPSFGMLRLAPGFGMYQR